MMSSEFYKTQMGARFFNKQLPKLTHALSRLADLLAAPREPGVGAEEVSVFFRDMMNGDWDVFQELSTPTLESYQSKCGKARERSRQLWDRLSKEQRTLLEQYQDALSAEQVGALEQAFLVGYQTAIKLVLLGVMSKTMFSREGVKTDES